MALRGDEILRKMYGSLKKELSDAMNENRAGYTEAKTELIEEAVAEYRRNKRE